MKIEKDFLIAKIHTELIGYISYIKLYFLMSLGNQNWEIQIQESFMHSKAIVTGSYFLKVKFCILRMKIHIWFFNRKVRESFEHYELGDRLNRNWKDESNPIKREEGLGFVWLLGKIKENRTQGASTIKKQFSNPGKFSSILYL